MIFMFIAFIKKNMITEEKILKIKSYKTWSERKKIDYLLMEDSFMYTNLGTDSTKTEKNKVKSMSKKIYKAISQISALEGYLLRAHMDEKNFTNGH